MEVTDPQLRVASAVSALLEQTGQTQKELADVLGLTQPEVSRRIGSKRAWSLRDVDRLSMHFRIDVCDLMAGPDRALSKLPKQLSAD